MKMNRRERRALARKEGVPFVPQYNGLGPITKEQYASESIVKQKEEK